jgi:hypothetical protein
MLDGRAVDLDTCRDMGIAMFAGEAEDRLDTVLRDAADGRLDALSGALLGLAAPRRF